MPHVVSETWVPVSPEVAFAVSQTTGDIRTLWDPFIRSQQLIDAELPAKGVRTFTHARVGPKMISQYVSYRPPTSVGMTMVSGPWFFASFGGGWRFIPETRDGIDGCRATWKYTFSTKPRWLSPVADRIGHWLLGREIRARIASWARGCENPRVLAALDL